MMTNRDLCYRKGFPSKDAVQAYQEVFDKGDVFAINAALPNNTERKQVDAHVFLTASQDIGVYQSTRNTDVPEVGSAEFEAEAQFVVDVAAMRDTPFDELTPSDVHLDAMRLVSYFLEDIQVRSFVAGQDFITTEPAWLRIMAGDKPIVSETREASADYITNGRAAATYVFDDDAIAPFMGAVNKMIALGVPYRREGELEQMESSPFSVWGAPFFYGYLGEVVRRVGLVSFRHKWANMVPRPEQYCKEQMGIFCSQAHAAGSPMHPSMGQMHGAVSISQASFLKEIFELTYVLPNGNTVGYELDLMADNIAAWRIYAGVHYESDAEFARPFAELIGKKVANKALT